VRKTSRATLVIVLAAAAANAGEGNAVSFFDGRALSGWRHVGDGRFVLQDGMLKTEGGMGLLYYAPRKVGRETVRVVYRTEKPSSNAGVFIRIPEKPTEPWMPVNKGYEVQIDESGDDHHVTGTLYSLTQAAARPGQPGKWNVLEITLDGPRTLVTLNGVKVTDYTEGQPVPPKRMWYEPNRGPRPAEGYVGLQNHGDKDVVFFKEISVRPLR
jgi:3-keto-disaccharide hydrolase